MFKNHFYFVEDLLIDNNVVFATIKLNPNHAIYHGHFTGNPVTPGVCQIQIVKEMLCEILQQTFILTDAKSIKFLNVLPVDFSLVIL